MNLGKLLGSGKSVMNGRKVAAYREDKRVYLPKFVSSKNPFANGPAPEAPAEAHPPAVNGAPVASTQPLRPAPAGPTRVTTWVSRLNPTTLFRGGQSVAGKNAVPVQTELSLEKVKVVHNDLTDAEVEVVPLKSRPVREAASPDRTPAKKSWENLGERIMKATAL